MKRPIIILALLAGCSSQPQAHIDEVGYITDSVGHGYSDEAPGYIDLVHVDGVTVYKLGENAQGTPHHLRRMEEWTRLFHGVDVLFINAGIWDATTWPTPATPVAEYEANLRVILSRWSALGVRVVWVQTTRMDFVEYNEAASRVVSDLGIEVIPLRVIAEIEGWETIVGYHYPEWVAREQAKVFADWILNANR